MTFSGPYEGIQWPYGRILNGGDKKSERWLPIGVSANGVCKHYIKDAREGYKDCHGEGG